LNGEKLRPNRYLLVYCVIKKLLKPSGHYQAKIIPRAEHSISRSAINRNALHVLYRLHEAGYSAYLVGGSVRDILLNHKPKDFDVATNAKPEQIKSLFRNCRLIGRRFRLAHVFFGREIIEVATFRSAESEASDELRHSQHGMILRDNVYGTLEEDAIRRDFTINALYYNIADFSVVDYSKGVSDLQKRLVRLIGDPAQRFREDPIRILRAIRFAAKLDFQLHHTTAAPIPTLYKLLEHVPPARLFDEILKLFMGGKALASFQLLRQHDLFSFLFPQINTYVDKPGHEVASSLLIHTFTNTDLRLSSDKTVNPAFLFAAMLWYPLQQAVQQLKAKGMRPLAALEKAMNTVIDAQLKHIAVPKRLTTMMREIWSLQPRLQTRTGKRALRVLNHPRFRAAYDFLLLRTAAGEDLQELATWWTDFQAADENARENLLNLLEKKPAPMRKRRKRKKPQA
jgi:poly(A) polymerase